MQQIIVLFNDLLSLVILEVNSACVLINLEDCPSKVRSDSLLLSDNIEFISILLAVGEHIACK